MKSFLNCSALNGSMTGISEYQSNPNFPIHSAPHGRCLTVLRQDFDTDLEFLTGYKRPVLPPNPLNRTPSPQVGTGFLQAPCLTTKTPSGLPRARITGSTSREPRLLLAPVRLSAVLGKKPFEYIIQTFNMALIGANGPQPQDDYAFSYQFDGMYILFNLSVIVFCIACISF